MAFCVASPAEVLLLVVVEEKPPGLEWNSLVRPLTESDELLVMVSFFDCLSGEPVGDVSSIVNLDLGGALFWPVMAVKSKSDTSFSSVAVAVVGNENFFVRGRKSPWVVRGDLGGGGGRN